VLNLGGNKIKVLENIEHLGVLTELNLRRNLVERIGNLGKLVNLQRLFLSNNRLETFESIDPLLALRSISELRLECNKISASKQEEYRTRMIHYFPSLKYLDLKPLTDSERKEAAILYPERIKDGLQLENASHKRIEGIKSARLWWEKSAQRIKNGIRRAKWNDSCLWDLPSCNEDITSLTEESSCDILTEVANGSTGLIGNEKRKLLGREEYCTFNNLAGFAEIEVYEGDYRVLCIYGDALDVMENVKYHTCIDAILFKYISLQKIGSFLCTSSTGNIKLFGRLRKLIFSHNDITSFEQMAWLASTGNRGEEVSQFFFIP
jgi:Leucine-rich repeat (LRR) protein